MKTRRKLHLSMLAAAVIAFAQSGATQPVPEPPADAAPAPKKRSIDRQEGDDVRPGEFRREVRIERRAPGGRVRIEERRSDGDVLVERLEEEETDEPRIEPFEGGPGARIERRILRHPDAAGRDVIIRRFPGGPEARVGVHPPRPLREPPAPAGRPGRERAEHLEQAMRHLREAGLPDLAQRLETRADRLRAAAGDLDGDRLRGEVARLRQEQEALKKELRKLRKEIADQAAKEKADR